MAAEEKPAAQGTLATVVATAAVTLAIGVTLAALGGYWTPAVANETKSPKTTEPTPAQMSPARPTVVFVPVAADPPPSDPGLEASPSEVTLARYERSRDYDGDDDDHRHHRRKHREHRQREQEREHEAD